MSYFSKKYPYVRWGMSDLIYVSCDFSPRRREEVETVSHHWLLSLQVIYRVMKSPDRQGH